jgi:beta-lactamase regulating signal transducer with metallopeptidase domain
MFQMLMADGVHAALASAGGWLVAFAQTAAPVAVAALWQGAAIALVLWVCLGLTPHVKIHIGAAQRFGLWAAAFAVVVGLGFLPWFARGTAGAIRANALPGASAAAPWFQIDDRWAFAIAALWLVASLVRAVSLAVHSLQLRRLWKSASPVAVDAKLRALLTAASPTRRSHSRKVAELCTARKLDRPSVIGFLAPRILIPEWLFARLTPDELEQVVLHEAEHLRRRDDWTNLFQKLALVLFPLNPALAWIESRLCREREMACDEGVVRRTHAPRAYAECLTSLAERRLELRLERRRAHALSLGAFERRPELVRRVYSILSRKQALHPVAARLLVGVAGCSLLVASVELARCPQMVAFVPAAQTTTAQTETARTDSTNLLRDGDRAFVKPTIARDASGFRAVDTKATLPARHGIAQLTPASSRRAATPSAEPAGAPQRQIASTSEAPREVLLRAEMPDADARPEGQETNSRIAGEPQYVVLTAWEEVRTSRRLGGQIADYDTDASAPPQSADAPDPADPSDSQTVTRITVTRLIFAVYPIGFGPNGSGLNSSGPNSKPAHAEDSGRPPSPLPVSGWLVLQL